MMVGKMVVVWMGVSAEFAVAVLIVLYPDLQELIQDQQLLVQIAQTARAALHDSRVHGVARCECD